MTEARKGNTNAKRTTSTTNAGGNNQATEEGQASLYSSPVQDAVAKVAMDPKLSNGQIAEKVRKVVKGSLATAKSVATQVRLLREKGVKIPPRMRQPQAQRIKQHA